MSAAAERWKALYLRMRNIAAGYSNQAGVLCRLDKEYKACEEEARTIGTDADLPIREHIPYASPLADAADRRRENAEAAALQSVLMGRFAGARPKAPAGLFTWAQAALECPVDMVLRCPKCGGQHIDKPESDHDYNNKLFESSWWELGGDKPARWNNPPHRSHYCAFCKFTWRPSDRPTNGVESILTKGKKDGSY